MAVPAMHVLQACKVAAGFDPTSISGCSLWLDADDASTFTYSSGVVVSQWDDKSGMAHHVSQGTGANQPSRNGSQNGRTTVAFDGTNDSLAKAAAQIQSASDGTWSVFVACETTTVSGVHLLLDGWSVVAQYLRINGATSQSILRPTNSGDDGPTVSANTAMVLHATRTSGGANEVYLNNVSGGATTGMGTAPTGTNAVTVGDLTGGGFPWSGEVFEVICYQSVLSSGDRGTVVDYLMDKWGIS